MKKIACLALLASGLFPCAASAQTQGDIAGKINTMLAPNARGAITASSLQSVLSDLNTGKVSTNDPVFSVIPTLAPLNSPVFIGTPSMPSLAVQGAATLGGASSSPNMTGLGFQLYARRTASGTSPGGVNLSLFNVESDTANVSGSGFVNVLSANNAAYGGPTAIGGRQGFQGRIAQGAPTSATNQNRNYVGSTFISETATGDGGKGLSSIALNPDGSIPPGVAAGAYFGINTVAIADGSPFTGNTLSGSPTITGVSSNGSFPNVVIGQYIRGVKGYEATFPDGTVVSSFDASAGTITASKAAAQTQTTAPFGASGAQYLANLSSGEINIAAQAGSTVYYKSGLQIASLPSDTVPGSTVDSMIVLSNQGGAIGWRDGLLFTDANGQHPINANGFLLRSSGAGRANVGISALGIISSSFYAGTGNRPLFAAPDGTLTQTATAVPASSTSACQVGQYAAASGFAYFCVAANTWQRAALSTF